MTMLGTMHLLARLLGDPWPDFAKFLLAPLLVALTALGLLGRAGRRGVATALCVGWGCACAGAYLIFQINSAFDTEVPKPLTLVPIWLAIGLGAIGTVYLAAQSVMPRRRPGE